MDKNFLNELADKLENVQILSAELDKTHGHDVDGVKADYEEACADLERLLFGWIEGLIIDPEPDKPEKTSKYYCAIADKASELGLLLVDMGNYLLDCSKDWRR